MIEITSTSVHQQTTNAHKSLTRSQVVLMSVLCALSAASIYYSQVMVEAFAKSFGVSSSSTAWLSGLSHAGYVLGLILLVPLGDRFEKRGVVAILGTLSGCAMLLAAMAKALPFALFAATMIGVFATTASLTIPMCPRGGLSVLYNLFVHPPCSACPRHDERCLFQASFVALCPLSP